MLTSNRLKEQAALCRLEKLCIRTMKAGRTYVKSPSRRLEHSALARLDTIAVHRNQNLVPWEQGHLEKKITVLRHAGVAPHIARPLALVQW
jgi:hypothetical protein